jgi:hypothetical protein
MKSLFKDPENESVLELGIENNNKLSIIMEDNSDYLIHLELDLQEAIVFQYEVSKYLEQIKAKHRAQLPWHKQLGI